MSVSVPVPVPQQLVNHLMNVLGQPSKNSSKGVASERECQPSHYLVLLAAWYRRLIMGLCGYGVGACENDIRDIHGRIVAKRTMMTLGSYLTTNFMKKTPVAMHYQAVMLLSCGRCIDARNILQRNHGVYRESAILLIDIFIFGRRGIEKDYSLCRKILDTLSDDPDVDGLRAILNIAQGNPDEPNELAKIALLLRRSRDGGSIYSYLALECTLPFILRRFMRYGIDLPVQPPLRQVASVLRHPYAQLKLANALKRRYESWWYYNEPAGVPPEVVAEFNALQAAAATQGLDRLR